MFICMLANLNLLVIFVDIVNGNVKSVMRLVLALAAHFKPSSVKATTGMQKQSIAVLAQVC